MISTLMVSLDKKFFTDTENILAENNFKTDWSLNGTKALVQLSAKPVDLIIIDEQLPDMTGRQFIEKIIMKNPTINCVVASPLPKHEFHQAYDCSRTDRFRDT